MAEMKTLTIGGNTYEVVDETARKQAAAAVKTINGNAPDSNGNVEVEGGSGGISRVLLWENADPISEFPEQTIQLNDLPYYDAIEVIFTPSGFPGGYGRCYLSSGVLPKITDVMDTYYYPDGYALQSVADFYSPSGVRNYYRLFSWDGTQIKFENGTYVDYYSGIATDNYCNIPARIYGIKGVESL